MRLGYLRRLELPLLAILPVVCAGFQTPQGPAGEITTREAAVTFRSRVNLVSVPVVVRDSKGRTVGDLEKEDFQLFDGGKPQIISRFSVENLGRVEETHPATGAPQPLGIPAAAPPAMPRRFVALLFDDLHTEFGNLVWARQAAEKLLASTAPTERVAIYTSSGQNAVDFTNDRDLLAKELRAMRSGVKTSIECPQISYFVADLILNKHSEDALNMMIAELNACRLANYTREEATNIVRSAAIRALAEGDWNTRQAMATLRAVIGKLATTPGQRQIVLISDGFLVLDEHRQIETDLIEAAIRAGVVIDGLDARGLKAYVPGGDASQRGPLTPAAQIAKITYDISEGDARADVMAEAASGTGGRFVHNTNAVDEGLARLAGTPEFIYVLGFAPQNLKYDGRYHGLKVTLRNGKGLNVEARRGYYAPNRALDPAEQAKDEIQAAFFSTEDIREIPAAMETQFFKTGDAATVDVLAKVNVKQLNFRQEAGRNRNDVTIVCGLFDENGNYVSGIQKVLEMRLKDETLETRLASGIAVRTSLNNVKPGRYSVRMVVRDAEGQALTALSGAVEIP